MLIVVLLIALVIFGTKRLRSIGSDLGAAVKGFSLRNQNRLFFEN